MYNLFKKIISTSALAGIAMYSSSALSESFEIIDFKFSMQQPDFSDEGGPAGANIVGEPGPWGTLVDGTYQGSNSTNELINFTFFGATVNVYTAASNQGSVNTPAGSITGGPAPDIDIVNLTADMSSWFAHWSGTEFLQGNNNNFAACASNPNFALLSADASVRDNLNGTYTVSWNSCISTAPFVSQIGFWQLTLDCLDCGVVNPGPADSLSATQGGQPTRQVTATGGNVIVTSSFGPSPANYLFDWSESDAALTDINGAEGRFTFDPTGLAPGNYVVSTTYTDGTNSPTSVEKGKGSIIIKVVASAAGIDINDTNNNGIINEYDDASLAATQLQAELSNGTTYVLQSDKGSLKVGQTAFCAEKAARASLADMAAFAGENCTAITNSTDAASFVSVGTGGYHDFEIHGLTLGDSAQVVIPLNAGIPDNAVYRKYIDGSWATFTSGEGDSIASTMATSAGVCPAPGSTSYITGLNAGDTCLQLTITDGGINDADGAANGQILDPGTLADIKSGTEPTLSSGCSITGNADAKDHIEWFLVAGFIALLGWFNMSRRKA